MRGFPQDQGRHGLLKGMLWTLLALVLMLGITLGWGSGLTRAQSSEPDAAVIRSLLQDFQELILDDEQILAEGYSFFASDVELLHTEADMLDLRRLYSARVLADRRFLEAAFLEILKGYRSAYAPGLDPVAFVLDYEFSLYDEDAAAESEDWDALWETEWQRLYEEESWAWDAAWFDQWNTAAADVMPADKEPDPDMVQYFAPGEWDVLVQTARSLEDYRLRDADAEFQAQVTDLYIAVLLSDEGWDEELYWVFSDTFWQWPGYYRLSSAGNFTIPGDLAAAFFGFDSVMFHVDEAANRFGRHSSIHYTVLDTGQQGFMDLIWAEDAFGWYIAGMSVEWSLEWELALEDASYWVGYY